jgi:rhamnosyltransferase
MQIETSGAWVIGGIDTQHTRVRHEYFEQEAPLAGSVTLPSIKNMLRPDATAHPRQGAAEVHSPDPPLDPATVMALVVTYHPDPGVSNRMRALIGTVGAILFVDNGSRPDEIASLEPLVREGDAHLMQNERNVGLATALNQGFRWAADRGFAWVLTLDQDTEPTSEVVPEATRVLAAHADRRIAVIGAGYGEGTVKGLSPVGGEVAYVITAGALHSVSAWQHLGGFRDDFFIDYLDTEFCLRARSRGYAVLRAGRSTVRHSIGSPITHDLGFRTFTPSNHSRRRRYYITRNRIIVWRAYARREPRYVAFDVRASLKELVKLVLFEGDRAGKLRAVMLGARDGLRGATGERGLSRPGRGTPSAGVRQ